MYKIKMDQKWILILVILVFYQKLISGAEIQQVEEGLQVEINCRPSEPSSLVTWFRILDNSSVEFIASFGSNGNVVKHPKKIYSDKKIQENILILKSFNKAQDSGIYTCVCIKSNELKFGKITRLVEKKVNRASTVMAAPTTTTKPNLSTTTCACKNKNYGQAETSPDLYCTPVILGPLAGACGLLLLLLIFITLHCNQIRTRRCPHHYRRKPRNVAPGKQMMTNRHV